MKYRKDVKRPGIGRAEGAKLGGKARGEQVKITELTPKQYRTAERLAGLIPETMLATRMGISVKVFKRFKATDPRLITALKNGEAKRADAVSKTLFSMAVSGKVPGATIFYAKSKLGYQEKPTGDEAHEPQSEEARSLLAQLSTDEIRQIVGILRAAKARGTDRSDLPVGGGARAGGAQSARVH